MLIEKIEDGNDEQVEEFPDFYEIYELLSDEIDVFISMLEDFIEQESDEDVKFNNQKYFSKIENDYETFLISLKNLLTLLETQEGDEETE
jgi:hypothetical protein